MSRIRIFLLTVVCLLSGAAHSPFTLAQKGNVPVDWKAELRKAQTEIAKNPKSDYWHNQAGIAYDALGDFQRAVKELKLASALDPKNPTHDYALYALYKRRGLLPQQRAVLLNALEIDPNNPVGRFGFALVLENEKHWADSLREYRAAKLIIAKVEGPEYIDPRGNPYDVNGLREEVDKAIDRVAKQNASKQRKK